MAPNSVTTFEIANTAELPLVSRLYATCADCWSLTKPEVNFLILITTVAGFYLGSSKWFASFPIAAADSHADRNADGGQRRRNAESVCRTALRLPNAADCPTPTGCGQ